MPLSIMNYDQLLLVTCALVKSAVFLLQIVFCATDKDYGKEHKSILLVALSCCVAVKGCVQIPIYLDIFQNDMSATLSCSSPLAVSYTALAILVPLAMLMAQIDVAMEMICPRFYNGHVTLRRWAAASALTAIAFAAFVAAAHQDYAGTWRRLMSGWASYDLEHGHLSAARVHNSTAARGGYYYCADAMFAALLVCTSTRVAYVTVMVLVAAMGLTQIAAAVVGKCLAKRSGDGAQIYGKSKFYTNGKEMCCIYAIGTINFFIFLLISLLPYIGVHGNTNRFLQRVTILISAIFPWLIMISFPLSRKRLCNMFCRKRM